MSVESRSTTRAMAPVPSALPASVARLFALSALAVLAASCGGSEPRTSDAESAAAEQDFASSETAEQSMPQPFVLAFLPSQRAEEIIPDARLLGDYLSAQLGVDVDVQVPTAYEPIIEGLRFGHVHAAFLDGGPAWIAHNRAGSEVILAEVNDGRTHYWAEAFVLTDSPIRALQDLPGNGIAFTSRTGSSGFIMPVGSMIQEGLIEPGDNLLTLEDALQETFSATVYAGGYKPALEALLEGRVDAAFGAHDAPERFLSPEERTRIQTLHRFGRIPSHAVVVSGDLSPEIVSRITTAMLALNEPDGLPLLRAIYGVDGLTEADTQGHLGEFGAALSALPGMDETLLAESN